MPNKPENPMAYPSKEKLSDWHNNGVAHLGMTLRDYFAGQAMEQADKCSLSDEDAASFCYDRAKAMLAERAKHG